jgi:hypothetical protein
MAPTEETKEAIIYIHPSFKAKSCPCCGKGIMHVIMNFGANAPPSQTLINALKNNKPEQDISFAS